MVSRVLVSVGDSLSNGDAICVIEIMKMEQQVASDSDGVVVAVHVQPGALVESGQAIADVEMADPND
jgi:biotin carboxyl carrier protein